MKRRQTRRLLELWRNIGQNETNIKALVKMMKRYLKIGPRFLYLLYTEFGGVDYGGLFIQFGKPPYTSLITGSETRIFKGYAKVGHKHIIQFKFLYCYCGKGGIKEVVVGEIEYVNPWKIQDEWRRDAMMTQRWIITAQNSTA